MVDHNLHRSSVDMITVEGDIAYRITFRSYKHSPDEFPDFVLIQHPDTTLCPVTAMFHYLAIRPSGDGPLFTRHTGPITRWDMNDILDRICRYHGWSHARMRPHSFRIGRATLWAQQGFTATQIQHMGRWRSDCFMKYIRPSVVVLQ